MICTFSNTHAAQQSPEDRKALIQIDRLIDKGNRLNWNVSPQNTTPGDGSIWSNVTWDNTAEARVRSIYLHNVDAGNAPFNGLPTLKNLYLIDCDVMEVTGITNHPNLETVRLDQNYLRDATPLGTIPTLKSLRLTDNEISDISTFNNLTQLVTLMMENNRVTDISCLASNSQMVELVLSGNRIQSAHGLQNMNKLETLKLNSNDLEDIADLNGLQNLRYAYLQRNRIRDASSLIDLPQLQLLDIDRNCLSLSQLHTLMKIELVHMGRQYDVRLQTLDNPLFTGREYDLSQESSFNGEDTFMYVYFADGRPCIKRFHYAIEDYKITFYRPGNYILRMMNNAVYSHGHDILIEDPAIINVPKESVYAFFRSKNNPYCIPFPPAIVETEVLNVVVDFDDDTIKSYRRPCGWSSRNRPQKLERQAK